MKRIKIAKPMIQNKVPKKIIENTYSIALCKHARLPVDAGSTLTEMNGKILS